jgi:hypothetical protein
MVLGVVYPEGPEDPESTTPCRNCGATRWVQFDEHGQIAGTPLTPADLESVEAMRGNGIRLVRYNPPHGSVANPHTTDPDVGEHCIQCGKRRLPGDEERWELYADMHPETDATDVLRRALANATDEELRQHTERVEIGAPGNEVLDSIRKLIAELAEGGEH